MSGGNLRAVCAVRALKRGVMSIKGGRTAFSCSDVLLNHLETSGMEYQWIGSSLWLACGFSLFIGLHGL